MAHSQEISRRKFLAGIAGASMAALLAACGGGANATSSNANATLQAVAKGGSPTAAPATTGAAPTTASAATTGSAVAGGGTPSAAPAQAAGGPLKQVARNRTLIFGITGSQLADYNIVNPFFLTVINTSSGYPYAFEAPYYYNSYNTDTVCGPNGMQCKDGFIPWLVESYENNADFTQYTLHVRKGVTWSDGQPFTSNTLS